MNKKICIIISFSLCFIHLLNAELPEKKQGLYSSGSKTFLLKVYQLKLAKFTILNEVISNNQSTLEDMKKRRLSGKNLEMEEIVFIECEKALDHQLSIKIPEWKQLKKELIELEKTIKAQNKKEAVIQNGITVGSPDAYQSPRNSGGEATKLFKEITLGTAPIKYQRSDELIKKNLKEISKEAKDYQ